MHKDKKQEDDKKLGIRALKHKWHRACLENSDLPRSFVWNALISLEEPHSIKTPFIPRSSTKRPSKN